MPQQAAEARLAPDLVQIERQGVDRCIVLDQVVGLLTRLGQEHVADALMRPTSVVIGDVQADDIIEVLAANDNEVFERFVLQTLTLRDHLLIRGGAMSG